MRMKIRKRLALIAPLMAATLLTGCENYATAYTIGTRDHALILVREQPYFWTSEVNQFLIVSRLPDCQRRYPIAPGPTGNLEIDVYFAGQMLWALRQGNQWYLASTEQCQMQEWNDKPDHSPPGPMAGRFRWDQQPTFELVTEDE